MNGFDKQMLYTAFMFHKNNPNYEQLIQAFNKIEDALNAENKKAFLSGFPNLQLIS